MFEKMTRMESAQGAPDISNEIVIYLYNTYNSHIDIYDVDRRNASNKWHDEVEFIFSNRIGPE